MQPEGMEYRKLELAGYAKPVREDEATVLVPVGSYPNVLFAGFLDEAVFALEHPSYLPICRFCDGEYRFYSGEKVTTCWGEKAHLNGKSSLYLNAISHIAECGFLAPNLNRTWRALWPGFMRYLEGNGVPLSRYVPFYFVYALMVNPRFLASLKGKNVLLVSSFGNKDITSLTRFMARHSVNGVEVCEIPDRIVSEGKFELKVRSNPDVAFVGAGIGAPLVLKALEPYKCLCIDAGFALHVWDGTRDKSERLFCNYTGE